MDIITNAFFSERNGTQAPFSRLTLEFVRIIFNLHIVFHFHKRHEGQHSRLLKSMSSIS